MAVIHEVIHTTTYSYSKPVSFGEHRAIFLPRGSFGGRVFNYDIKTNVRAEIRWLSDSLSNNVAIIVPSETASELTISCRFSGIHYGVQGSRRFELDPRAENLPVQYSSDEWIDLVTFMRPHAEDPDGEIAAWARSFLKGGSTQTLALLQNVMETIGSTFTYEMRNAEGTQTPSQTLREKRGTCRDYAWLMIETLRRLGFACRFISGYLYDTALDGGTVGAVGSGATHAWLAVFLPGAGWLTYDPTNQLNSGSDLIPVAIARHPGQAMPLVGAWFGSASDYLGMKVDIKVHKLAEVPIDIPGEGHAGTAVLGESRAETTANDGGRGAET